MKDLLRTLTSSTARRLFVACGIGAVLIAIAIFWPIREGQLGKSGRALELSDRYGQRLGTLYSRDERHAVSVPLARISTHFSAAIVSAEDHRFFQHGAIDGFSFARAALDAALRHHGLRGASTISIQLARLIVPISPTLRGKFAEALLAMRLESGLSKTQILEAYCNRIPMGSNLYGVEAASRTYFGIAAADLDLAQASLLAALPNDPVRLDPYRHWPQLKLRQRYVLARMEADGIVSPQDASRAASERITPAAPATGIVSAPHFLFWLAPQIPALQTQVTTTIDLALQRFVQAQVHAVVRSLAAHEVSDASAIVIDNRSGEILAYVGSPDYFEDGILGRNDGVQALRQPGSALKPFLYELALERRVVRPTTMLADVPTAYALPDARIYRPQDYSNAYQGSVRVRLALANSLNVPAVRVLERTGVPAFLDRLHELGFSRLEQAPEYYGLGLTLGGGEVSLYELARAYARAARGGTALPLRATLATSPGEAFPVTGDPASWALVTDMLADAHARALAFGVNSVLRLPFPAAVKTGTSSDYRDTWTVGYTRDYTVGVWVGNFDGTPMRGVSGVSGAGPLWNRIMLHLYEPREAQPFAPPAGYVRRPICADTGTAPDRACRIVVSEYLDARDLRAYRRRSVHRPAVRAATLRIVFPQEGDRFAYYPASGPAQRIQFVFAGAGNTPRVSLNGHALTPAHGTYEWPLSLGEFRLGVRSSESRAVVHFSVVPPPRRRTGFGVRVSSS